MFSKLSTIFNVICLLILGLTLIGCQDTIPQRSTISRGQSVDGDLVCPEGQHEETEEDEETGEEYVICVDDPIVRPSGAIQFKQDLCICKDGKPISSGNCTTFCNGKTTNGAERLYANFTVTADIQLSGLGNVHGWCTKPLPGDDANLKCVLQAKDDEGNISEIDVTPIANSNSITADVQQGLSNDKTYVITLVEKASGAKSNSIQVIKYTPDTSIPVIGPLKQAPISQYTCLIRNFQTDSSTGDVYFDGLYQLHFYFLPRIPPDPIPSGTSNLICHDYQNPAYGSVDDALYPRLKNVSGVFNLWDTTDPRFYNNNGTGSAQDVNDIIIQKTRNFGGTIANSISLFAEFRWPGSPITNQDAGNANSNTVLGYFMAPWIDQQTFKSYCLTSTHYNSTNALFKALRDVIEVDTEGLYIGERAAETVTNTDGTTSVGPKDYILIRETDLKAVWFYLNNGVATQPTDNNVANVPVYFYYPLNKNDPFVNTSTNKLYQVRGANELSNVSNSTSNDAGTSSTYPPHDRKIGCVPKF